MDIALNIDTMRQAMRYLIGMHDFLSFRDTHCERSWSITKIKDTQIIESNLYLNNLNCTSTFI